MPVSIKVNGEDNSLVHKGSNHIAKNTPPDVCKTPSPGGPVPIPYPIIISMSSDLAKGTTTVKVDGGNMAAIKGSELSRCSGDEAGTAGGVVSSTNMKEATWITYSMNVKMDGKNACRLTDKMKMNHGNTVCMVGIGGMPCRVTTAAIKEALCEKLCNYHNQSRSDTKSSKKLEANTRADKRFEKSGVQIAPKGKFFVGGIETIPDAVHVVGGVPRQTFDFKRCGLGPPRRANKKPGKPIVREAWKDTYHGGDASGAQKERMRNLTTPPSDPITISCDTCTECKPRCYCPKDRPATEKEINKREAQLKQKL